MAHHYSYIVHRMLVGVMRQRRRHIGGRIATRVERDATMVAAEMLNLFFPAPQVAGELMGKYDGGSRAGLFVVEARAVRLDVGHDSLLFYMG